MFARAFGIFCCFCFSTAAAGAVAVATACFCCGCLCCCCCCCCCCYCTTYCWLVLLGVCFLFLPTLLRKLHGDGCCCMFVWILSAMTVTEVVVTKVVEGCVYIRRRYYGILPRVGGEFEYSALSPLSLRSLSFALSSNATTLNHLIRLRGSQGIQIWKQ